MSCCAAHFPVDISPTFRLIPVQFFSFDGKLRRQGLLHLNFFSQMILSGRKMQKTRNVVLWAADFCRYLPKFSTYFSAVFFIRWEIASPRFVTSKLFLANEFIGEKNAKNLQSWFNLHISKLCISLTEIMILIKLVSFDVDFNGLQLCNSMYCCKMNIYWRKR